MTVTARSSSVEPSSRIRVVGEWIAASAVILTCLRVFLTGAFLARPAITDRGTFIAYGKLVAGGAVMYRDVWDNKPPVIHLLGALAWTISPHVEAAYQMERLALLLFGAMVFAMLRYALGFRTVPALCGLAVGLVVLRNPEVFNGGYSTEEFGIVFEVVAVACVGLALRDGSASTVRVSRCGFGLFAALAILTRQTFAASLAVLWLAGHAYLARFPRRLFAAVKWEVAGFSLPVLSWLVYLWRTDSFGAVLELMPETVAFGSTPLVWNMTPNPQLGVGVQYWSPAAIGNTLHAKAIRAYEWFIAIVFHGDRRAAIAFAAVGMAAVLVATAARTRGRTIMRIPPLVLPFWFAAELAVASAPGNYFGHYYLPFVPLFACVAAVIAEVLIPRAPTSIVPMLSRLTVLLACLGATLWSLDAWYRVDPTKYWWLFAPNVHMPPHVVLHLEEEARRSGSSRYVPLFTLSPEVLLDMPLKPGTRFLAQYPFQFHGPESPRGRELLHDISAADVIVEDSQRLKLDRDLETQIQSIIRTSFVADFDWSHFHFYRRRDSSTP